MQRRAPLLSLVAAAALIACPQAHGADTIGEAWIGSSGVACEYGGTLVQTSSPGASYAAPYDGVITSWGTAGSWGPITFKVARLGPSSSYTILASDGPRTSADSGTLETFPVRFSVRQGDVIGGHVTYANRLCGWMHGDEDHQYGIDDSNTPAGGTGEFDETLAGQIPIEATIEPDADGDGYGDETQDECPTNATTQGPCPLPTVLGQTFVPITTASTGDTVVTGSLVSKVAAQQDGVITSWSYQANSLVDGTVKLKMFRPLGGDNYMAVGAAEAQTPVADSLNTYPTRISVRQGDLIGARREELPISSNVSASANSFAYLADDLATGESATFSPSSSSGRRLDISAVLEADADADGYGDTSQDACPTDASTQADCPVAEPPLTDSPTALVPSSDTTPPKTQITKDPKNKLDAAKAKYKFSSSEPDSTFVCKFDRKKPKPCDAGKAKFKHLDDGKHKFSVYAVDAAGNADPSPAKDKFKVL